MFFNTYHNDADLHQLPSYFLDSIVYANDTATGNIYISSKIICILLQDSDVYTLQQVDTQEIIKIPEYCICPSSPTATPSNIFHNQDNTLPGWIKANASATVVTDGMSKSKHITLIKYQDNQWYINIDRGPNREPLLIDNLHINANHLLTTSKLT